MIINKTAHDVVIIGKNKKTIFEPVGKETRVEVVETIVDVDGIPTVQSVYTGCSNIPPKNDGNTYIVSYISALFLMAQGYKNIVTPNTKQRVEGGVIGFRYPNIDMCFEI